MLENRGPLSGHPYSFFPSFGCRQGFRVSGWLTIPDCLRVNGFCFRKCKYLLTRLTSVLCLSLLLVGALKESILVVEPRPL